MPFDPTPEQLAIVSAASETTDNLLVQALAGAAKTSTLELIAKALPSTSILCLAFNKKIATEMQERMPGNVKAMTLNGLGHRTWMEATGRRMNLSVDKGYKIMTELVEGLSSTDRKEAYERFAELLKLVAFGKQCGYVPRGHYPQAKRLLDCDEFFHHIDQKLSDLETQLVVDATVESIKQSLTSTIDFDDQVFMPTIFHGSFPRYPLVLVDEAQDLSALNHATLRKLVGTRRIIAVGDSRQAIYGFRGAHEDSMAKLGETFNMRELVLSLSFRCPEAIVQHAQWRAPHMRAAKPGGSVTALTQWSADSIPDNAMILCRNNAPLFSCAIRMLKASRHCELSSGDVAKALLKVMTKFGPKTMLQPEVLDKIDAWAEKEKSKVKQRAWGIINDKVQCMEIFALSGATLGDAIAYVNHLINSTGSIKLYTGHKAKGLETDHVFILDADLISDEGQDPNLRYVMQTRAKQSLTYINSKDYCG